MTSVLKIYDDFTAPNKTSMAINAISTGQMIVTAVSFPYIDPLTFTISACMGSVLALFAKNNFIDHRALKTQGERNSLYSLLSLTGFFYTYDLSQTRRYHAFMNYLFEKHHDHLYTFLASNARLSIIGNGLRVGFLTTLLWKQSNEIYAARRQPHFCSSDGTLP